MGVFIIRITQEYKNHDQSYADRGKIREARYKKKKAILKLQDTIEARAKSPSYRNAPLVTGARPSPEQLKFHARRARNKYANQLIHAPAHAKAARLYADYRQLREKKEVPLAKGTLSWHAM